MTLDSVKHYFSARLRAGFLLPEKGEIMAGLKKARRLKEKQGKYKTRDMQPQQQATKPAAPANPFVMGTGNYGGTK